MLLSAPHRVWVSGGWTFTVVFNGLSQPTIAALTGTIIAAATTKQDQTITFTPPASQTVGSQLALSAAASSGLPVSFALVSGPATLNGNVLTFTGVGTVLVTASQAGNDYYNPAPSIQAAILVVPPPVVPFAAFSAHAAIKEPANSKKGEFAIDGAFRLGAGSDGIAPLTEDVRLQVGTFNTTIPAGSFKEFQGLFYFFGVIQGVDLGVAIWPLRGPNFQFLAAGTGADLTGTVNPVAVGLRVGDDGGTTTVTAQFSPARGR